MALSDAVTQGGQTFLHRLRMYRQIVSLSGKIAGALSMAIFVGLSFYTIPTKLWCLSGEYDLARFTIYICQGFEKYVDNTQESEIVSNYRHKKARRILGEKLKRNAGYGILAFFTLQSLLIYGWKRKGRKDRQNVHVSGSEVKPWQDVKKRLKADGKMSSLCFGSLPIVKNSETQHFLFSGTTGCGKTNAFYTLLDQIKDQKAVIVDTTGEFVSRYFDPEKDYLFNPFDSRSETWRIWLECQEPYHYKEVAENLICQSSHDPFWTNAARILFIEALKKCDTYDALINMLTTIPLKKLFEELAQTPAASVIDPTAEKTAASIRSTLSTHIECLSCLKEGPKPFSIRSWIQHDTKKGWLFLNARPEERAMLRPLLTTWLSIAIKSVMGCAPSMDRRVWFILDELPSLNKLPDLSLSLSEGRKYGACMAIGIQNMPQLEEIYGPHMVKSIFDLCSTKVLFRMADYDIAKKISNSLGEKEYMKVGEGISYGANDVRDGVNINLYRRQKPTVSPNDFLTLNDLESYVKLPGNYPISKIKWDIVGSLNVA